MKILILLLLLIGSPVFGETAWYATTATINISAQSSSSISTKAYKGNADIIWNEQRKTMEFEFSGNMIGTSLLPWATPISIYCCGCESTVLVSGYQRAVMICQIWDGQAGEIGQGFLTFKGRYYSTYDKWIVTGTYYGNGYGLIKGLNTIDQFSVSMTLIK